MRALANRQKFGEASKDVEYSVAAMGQDVGMLTEASNGRVRAAQAKDTQKLGAQAAKRLRSINAGAGANISGFSSLAFTPVQGLELAPTPKPVGRGDRNRPSVPMFSK
jgi:Prp31 C terminal domain